MKNREKRLLLLLAAGMMAMAVTGCGKQQASSDNTGKNTAATEARKQTTEAPKQTEKTTEAPATETSAPETGTPQTAAAQSETTQTPETGAPSSETSAPETSTPQTTAPTQSKQVSPLPSTISVANLTDGTVAASFSNDDIAMNDDGALMIHMTVYDYEVFDAAEITSLQAGDTLVIDGADLAVTSVETDADGIVQVNGGVSGGGVSLEATDGGTYCETLSDTADLIHNYQAIGDVTLPVDQDFVYTDSSDPSAGEQTYYAGDLIQEADTVDFSCRAANGTVTVAGGKIVSVTKIYMP